MKDNQHREAAVVVRIRGLAYDKHDGRIVLRSVKTLSQNSEFTVFFDDDGEIIAELATSKIAKVEWCSTDTLRSSEVDSWLQKARSKYANAYVAWTDTEIEQLIEESKKGLSIRQMSETHRRSYGAIRSRLIRMGLQK